MRHAEGAPVIGTAFLVSPRHVMTCAHVVNDALGRDWDDSDRPTETLWIEFPFAGAGAGLSASVIEWRPPAEADAADIAVLELACDAPFRPYRTSNVSSWRGQPFWTKGFPAGQDGGVDADGVIGTPIEFGRLLAHGGGLPGFFIEGGFSGAPVLDGSTGAVLGMAAAAVRDDAKRTAFLVPPYHLHLAWPPLARPYKGLNAFQEADAPYFHGRERYVDELAAKLDRMPLVAVVGRSGSGKSSLVRAGLIPRLRQTGDWRVIMFRPAAPALDPFRNLASALIEAADGPRTPADGLRDTKVLDDLAVALRERPASIVEHLRRMADSAQLDPPRLLLLADQFEELFTLVADPAESDPGKSLRAEFVRCLRAATDTSRASEPAARCIITIRADYLGRALGVLDMAEALRDADVKLGPMTSAGLRRAIEAPAKALGVTFEAGLVDDLLQSVGTSADALPLLEFTLAELWAKQQLRMLRPMPADPGTAAGYADADILFTPLIRHAEGVFNDLGRRFGEAMFRKVMVSLVWLGDPSREGEDTRRVRRKAEFDPAEWELIEQLASQDRQARLVTAGASPIDGEPTAEIVHEALIRGWPRLRAWLNEDRAFRLWLQKTEAEAAEWRRNRDKSDLLHGRRLAEAARWRYERIAQDSKLVADFLDASRQQDEEERGREEAGRHRRIAAVALVFAAILLASGVLLLRNYQTWEENRPWARVVSLTSGEIYPLTHETANIGRRTEGVRAVKHQVDVPIRRVSRIHLGISNTGVATDWRSLYGTTVNAEPLIYGESRVLAYGDIIALSGLELLVYRPIEWHWFHYFRDPRPPAEPVPQGWAVVLDGARRAVLPVLTDEAFVTLRDGVYGVSAQPSPDAILAVRRRALPEGVPLGSVTIAAQRDDREPRLSKTYAAIVTSANDDACEAKRVSVLAIQPLVDPPNGIESWIKEDDYRYRRITLPPDKETVMIYSGDVQGIGQIVFDTTSGPFQVVPIARDVADIGDMCR